MEYVILGLLLIMPNTIYGINKAFEQGISMFYSPSIGSLQSASKRLLDKNLIASLETLENGRVKKILTITDAGREAFFKWMFDPLDEKNLEVSLLSRLYFMGLLPTKESKVNLLHHMIENARTSESQLQAVNHSLNQLELPSAYEEIFFFQKKVLHYGIDTHQFGIKWLENLLREIESN